MLWRRGFFRDRGVTVCRDWIELLVKCQVGGFSSAALVSAYEPSSKARWNRDTVPVINHGQLLELLNSQSFDASQARYVGLLRACGEAKALRDGRQVHSSIVANGLQGNAFLQSNLVQMYLKCKSVSDARTVFETTQCPNVVLFTMMIGAYAELGCFREALEFFHMMQLHGTRPDEVAFVSVLAACGKQGDLAEVRMLHALVAEAGLETNTAVAGALVNMYGKCGSLDESRAMFDRMQSRDVLSWNAMIATYAQNGHCSDALFVFQLMMLEGMAPNRNTFVVFLNGLEGLELLRGGKLVHACAADAGFESDMVVGTALVNMYGNCGSPEDALRTFNRLERHDLIMWTAIITSYAQRFQCKQVLQLFRQMQLEGIIPDKISLINVLNACTCPSALAEGKLIHARAVESGFDRHVVVGNSIITMYNKCGDAEDARRFFDKMVERDMITWNAMIAAYTLRGQSKEALQLFQHLLLENSTPDRVSFVTILSVCSGAEALAQGKLIHGLAIESGDDSLSTVCNAIINMYGNCGNLEDAERVFNSLTYRDMVSWNAIITQYAQDGRSSKVFQLFREMQLEGMTPNHITFLGILSVCASQAALRVGKLVHARIVESGLKLELDLENALVNMYGKCGSLHVARDLFDKLPVRSSVSWNGMVAAYSQHGHSNEAIQLFHEMLLEGLNPNEVTFVCVLSACSHAGSVDKGCLYFISMTQDHGISPVKEHYGCMVDLLGRAGWLVEAEHYLARLPHHSKSWLILLGACKIHGDVHRGRRAAEHVIELDPQTSAGYIMLSNMYSTTPEKWEEADVANTGGQEVPKMEEDSA